MDFPLQKLKKTTENCEYHQRSFKKYPVSDFRTFRKKYSSRDTIPLNLVSYAGMNLPPLISRVPGSVRESKMSTDEENPGAQYNEAGLEKTRVKKKTSPLGFLGFFWGFLCVFWVFRVFFIKFAQKREFLGFFSFSRILLGASRL